MKVIVYGDGQLAQMLYLAGIPLGIEVEAVNVKTRQLVNPVSKQPLEQTLEVGISEAQALTVEFEHVPVDLLEHARASDKLFPAFEAIRIGADRVNEKQFLDSLSVPNCEHQIITDIAQLDGAIAKLGDKVIFKASLDGYDGYGQWRFTDHSQLPALAEKLSELDLQAVPLVAEKMVSFDRELSLIGARNANGEVNVYPLAENLHHDGQLHVSVAPATNVTESLQAKATEIFTAIVNALEYVGVMAVEMFQVGDSLLVNELAPRVHNSGHWSMHGAETSQFENQLRAVLNLPLGGMQSTQISAMVNIIGCGRLPKEVLAAPGCHLHWYGKSVREKRKMGHINVVADSYQQLGERLTNLYALLPQEYFPKLNGEAERLKKH